MGSADRDDARADHAIEKRKEREMEQPRDPKTYEPLVIAWYLGHLLKPQDFPNELWNWPVTLGQLAAIGYSEEACMSIKATLLRGEEVRTNSVKGAPVTLIAVLRKPDTRATKDMQRAALMAAKDLARG